MQVIQKTKKFAAFLVQVLIRKTWLVDQARGLAEGRE